ncbi:MAG: addiction module protein [Candidatus Methanospirareceae archaeon]
MSAVLEDLESLSVAEKILMVEDLWDNVASTSCNVSVPEWQKKELARRKAQRLTGSEELYTWAQIQADVQR